MSSGETSLQFSPVSIAQSQCCIGGDVHAEVRPALVCLGPCSRRASLALHNTGARDINVILIESRPGIHKMRQLAQVDVQHCDNSATPSGSSSWSQTQSA